MLPGTIKVQIVERRPALVVSLGAARWTVDDTGHVLVAGETSNNLPVLTGMQVDGIKPGRQLVSPEARAALAVWRSLPSSVKGDVQAIVAPATDRISLSLANGTVVRYGSSAQLHAKRAVLISLLARLAADHQSVSYIDLSVAADPAVAPLASPAAPVVVAPAVTPSSSTTPSPTPQPTPSR
jgi:cell division protein FtsQ